MSAERRGAGGAAPAAPPARARARSLEVVLPLAVLAAAVAGVALLAYQPIGDPDSFWHVRLGEYVLQGGAFVGPEPWSPFGVRPMVLHEWALEVVYAGLFRLGEWSALAWFQAAMQVALLVTLYRCARRFAAPAIAVAVTLVGWFGASGSFALRPQVASYVLVAVVVTAWLATARDGRPRWWLVPLSYLWVCAHGLWVLGPAIGVAAVVGMTLDRRTPRRVLAQCAGILILSVAVAALTPIGHNSFATALAMRAYTPFVTEYASPWALEPQFVMVIALAAVVVALWVRRGRPTWAVLALFAVGLGLTLYAVRTVAVGSMVLSLVAAATLGPLGGRVSGGRREAVVVGVMVLLTLGLLPQISVAPVSRPQGVPDALDASLDALPEGTVVLNDFTVGGWLLLEHPHLRPVVDGRADVYSVRHFAEAATFARGEPGWQGIVARSGAAYALLTETAVTREAMETQLHWAPVASGDGWVLLRAPSACCPVG